ncbi:MAG TPA: hypothetical protein VHP36_09295 [Chitinispirillaceae bacterium]|nr:hypothetical protein [Chitinispirillaceae bacterium]
MKIPLYWSLLSLFTLMLSPVIILSQEDESSENTPEVTVDTCGKLQGNIITYTSSLEYATYVKGYQSIDQSCSIDMMKIEQLEDYSYTSIVNLLSWKGHSWGMGPDVPYNISVEIKKNDLKLFDYDRLLGWFRYIDDTLVLAPEFRIKILNGLDSGDTTILYTGLQDIIKDSPLGDDHIFQVLQLYEIRNSIREGVIDQSIDDLKKFSVGAVDDSIRRYCTRWADSLSTYKKTFVPVKLINAKKIGTILSSPVYPPLDSPTVFWKDTLLCVVQESNTIPEFIRAFNPRNSKWGPKETLKYPESGMSKLYVKNTGTYSMACPYLTVCWNDTLGKFNDDPCDGFDCSPILMLRNPQSGSLNNQDDLTKAGGSCAAGFGKLEFNSYGKLFWMSDTGSAWQIFPEEVIYGTRKYSFDLKRDYPVVVSPDQNWIAYALRTKNDSKIQLWVAQLEYNKKAFEYMETIKLTTE